MRNISIKNRTSIICTLGPATSSEKTVTALIGAGMAIARFNFSHGDYSEHAALIKKVKRCAAKAGKGIGILIDLPGPKLRAGKFPEDRLELNPGEKVYLASRPSHGHKTIVLHNERVLSCLRPGSWVFLSDGLAKLTVEKRTAQGALCVSMSHAVLRSRCGINIPDADLPLSAFTVKDRELLKAALKEKPDFVAVSFVAGPEDIRMVRKFIKSRGGDARVVAKIERRVALSRLADIVREADAVMVARGDLGVELAVQEVPFAQKSIIAECRKQFKPAIVATQMLESMIANPRPTRAELTDIANAALDGADAVMLSGETSVGHYPVEAVETLVSVLIEAEKRVSGSQVSAHHALLSNSVAAATVALAYGIDAQAIVTPTFSGETTRMISALRPACPVIALCKPGTEGRFSIFWGVRAFPKPFPGHKLQSIIAESCRAAVRLKAASKGARIVVACSLSGHKDNRLITTGLIR